MEIRPVLKIRQELALSPRLYQSLRILRLSAFDLQELIQKELDENPALEIPEAPEESLTGTDTADQGLWDEYLGANRDGAGDRRQGVPLNPTELTASPVTLADHLSLQLDLESLSAGGRIIGDAIIGSLDDHGYLRESIGELARETGREPCEVEAVLEKVQRFDPPGIAARDLRECLLLQLDQLQDDAIARKIIVDYLALLARNDITGIARALSVHPERIRKAVALIRSLDPSPGALFDTAPPAGAIIPDVYISRDRDGIHILANRDILPSLRLSSICQELAAAGKGATDDETRSYARSRLRAATELIRDIDQRRTTVTRVAEAIAAAQAGFFRYGPAGLRPLSLDDIASRLEVHPSTISRTIIGKYMSTPFGVFEFRYFFASGYDNGSGEGVAATAVRQRLAELIAAEDHRRPLSDQKLAGLLKLEQINISRRTVAKYREQAHIPPSWQRKREAS